MLVSIVTGRIYHFDLNEDRTELILSGLLADKVAETRDTGIENIVFAEEFGGVTDLEVSPDDGYLYVVSLGHGAIYKILPAAYVIPTTEAVEEEEEEEEENDKEDIEAVEEEEEEEEEEG
jgi:hypothetical protein